MLKIFRRIKNRFLRIAVIVLCILFIFVVVVIAFISPIAKYLIETYSEKYTGRKIEMSWLYLNPFTGAVNAHNLVVFEEKSPQPFIKAGNFSCNVAVMGLLGKKYEVSSVMFDRLWVNVIQDSTVFNFSDLIPKDTIKKDSVAPVHYAVRNVKIKNSEFHYQERTIPVSYFIKDVDIECTGVKWDVDTTHVEFSFESGPGSGEVKGTANYNLKESLYDVQTKVTKFDLKVLEQYLKDFAAYGYFAAFLDADIHAKGDMDSSLEMSTSGSFAISDFHFGKDSLNDYVSFRRMAVNIDSLSPANKKYFFSALVIDTPFIKYERYDHLDNFTTMFGKGGSNIEEAKAEHHEVNIIFLLSDYLKELAKNIIDSQYRLDKFDINSAKVLYNDYSLVEKFSVNANPITITARNIDTRKERMDISLKMNLNPFGHVNLKYDVNPNDFGDFHLVYKVDELPMAFFNPYSITYASYPFHKGTVEVNGKWVVVNKQINSDNRLVIINPTTAEKVKNRGTKHLPVPLLMAFVRDFNRRIDIELPITGNLEDPKFNYWDAVFDVLSNILIKPPTTPYRVSVENQKEEKEEYVLLEWKPLQTELENDQEDQLRKISRFLFMHPASGLIIKPKYFQSREKEAILFYEAKKKYYLASRQMKAESYTEKDSIEVNKMSVKDSSFVKYLDKHANHDGLEFTVQGKCRKLVTSQRVNQRYEDLLEARKKEVILFFEKQDGKGRVTFEKGVDVVPPSGFSHYLFNYKGERPEKIETGKEVAKL